MISQLTWGLLLIYAETGVVFDTGYRFENYADCNAIRQEGIDVINSSLPAPAGVEIDADRYPIYKLRCVPAKD